MKSIERRFNNIKEKNIDCSSFLIFSKAVNEQKFSKDMIHRWFNKLVNSDDYERKDKRNLLIHLNNLSNSLRTTDFRGKTAHQQEI